MSFRAKAEAEAIKHRAIERLAIARREKLAKVDYDVYLDGLQVFEAETVRRVCDVLGTEVPGEFEPRFPPLAVIAERCRVLVQRRREREEDERRSRTLKLPAGDREVSPDRLARFRQDVEALVRRKAMP
jgi:hypothetical protein